MMKLLVSLIIVLSLFSCGREELSSLEQVDVPPPLDVVVASAGWNSCRGDDYSPRHSGTYRGVQELIARYPANRRPEVISSCFTIGGSLHYQSSDGSEIQQTANPDVFLRVVATKLREYGNRVALVGHSHGGWLMMRLVKSLGRFARVKSLHTLDPISYRTCSYHNFLRNSSCHSAPDDFTAEDLQEIRSQVKYWRHDYQRRSSWLRSSSIDEADVSHEHAMAEYSQWGFAAHQDMDDLGDVWRSVSLEGLQWVRKQ